jgi:hypothetical protein
MRTLVPVTISSADLDVALVADGIAAAWSPGSVRVENRSRWKLQCSIGANLHSLSPWTADVWPVRSATTMHVHPVGADPMVPGQATGVLFVDVAEAFEIIPGTYPAALAVQPSAAEVPATLAQASGVSSFPIPAGTVCVGWAATGGNNTGNPTLSIIGAQSGEVYAQPSTAALLKGGIGIFPPGVLDIFEIDPVDTSLNVAWSPAAGMQLFMWTLSLPGHVFVSNRPGQLVQTVIGNALPQQSLRFVGPFPTTQATATEVLAGVAGQIIWLFSLSLANDTVAAASSLHLVTAPHGSPGLGTIFGDVSTAVGAPAPIGAGAVGTPTGPAGNSLYVWQDSGAVTPRGTLIVAQG